MQDVVMAVENWTSQGWKFSGSAFMGPKNGAFAGLLGLSSSGSPVVLPRGLPLDLSSGVAEFYAERASEDSSGDATYLTLDELIDVFVTHLSTSSIRYDPALWALSCMALDERTHGSNSSRVIVWHAGVLNVGGSEE